MVLTAAHLVENVLPKVPLRQVVVSFPKWLRHYLNQDAGLFNRVIRIVQGEIIRAIQTYSPDAPEDSGVSGIVFIRRFGSALNAHPHLHLVLIDGVIAAQGDSFSFHPAHLNQSDSKVIREAIRTRVLRLFKRRGLLEEEVIENLRAWGHGGGFSVHTDVCVPSHDKAGRERLIPPPRRHRHRYFVLLTPNSPWRKAIVAQAGLPVETGIPKQEPKTPAQKEDQDQNDTVIPRLLTYLWAMLIARIYEVSPLVCPNCGADMRVIAFIEEIEPVRRILTCVGEPTEPTGIHPPRAPPDWAEFDQTITLEDASQDTGDWEFDQTVNG